MHLKNIISYSHVAAGIFGTFFVFSCGHLSLPSFSATSVIPERPASKSLQESQVDKKDTPHPAEPADEVYELQSKRSLAQQGQDQLKPTFDWPVEQARFIRGFDPKKSRRHRPHLGIDLAAKKGSPILASVQGTVIYVGKEFRGYGKMVLIEGENGWATLYAHLDKVFVSEGQKIYQGEVIAGMGRTGRATGVHLHFEIRHNKGPVDPLPFLPKGTEVAAAKVVQPDIFEESPLLED